MSGTATAEPSRFSTGAATVLRSVALVSAVIMGLDALLYAILGIDGALATLARLFGLTYPVVNGRVAMPLLSWVPGIFHAHVLATYLHVLLLPVALLIGPLQLSARLRQRRPQLHRLLGRCYAGAVFVGVPAGVYLGIFSGEGIVATMGYFGMGLSALVCTVLAWHAAQTRDFVSHRAFMIRSYVVLFTSAIGLRLLLLLLVPRLGPMPQGFHEPYVICVFLTWSLGLLSADIYLYLTRHSLPTVDR